MASKSKTTKRPGTTGSQRPKTRAGTVKKGKTDIKKKGSPVAGTSLQSELPQSSPPGKKRNWIQDNPHLVKKFTSKQKLWLKKYPECGSIRKTAVVANVSITSYYEWMNSERHSNFQLAMESLKEQYVQLLEDAATERAVHGIKEDVFFKDQVIGEKTVYSDSLLNTLLKAHKPEVYNKPREISGPDGGAIPFTVDILDSLLGED